MRHEIKTPRISNANCTADRTLNRHVETCFKMGNLVMKAQVAPVTWGSTQQAWWVDPAPALDGWGCVACLLPPFSDL